MKKLKETTCGIHTLSYGLGYLSREFRCCVFVSNELKPYNSTSDNLSEFRLDISNFILDNQSGEYFDPGGVYISRWYH